MIEAQLNSIRDQIARRIQLEDLTSHWRGELSERKHQVELLHTAMLAEQNDVDKLEAGGLGTVFHKLTGRMEEKLDKERMEAKTAADEYHTAASRLETLENQLREGEAELDTLRDCQKKYSQIMLDRIHQLENRMRDPNHAEQAEDLKIQLQLERRRKSLRESLLESSEAARAAIRNLEFLSSADEKPALMTQEHYLQNAAGLAQILMEEIGGLQSKLAQMGIDPEPHISIGPYLRAPVVFLASTGDGISPNLQFKKAIQELESLQNQIAEVDKKLNDALTQIESALAQF